MSRPVVVFLLVFLAGAVVVYAQVGRDFEDVCGIRPVPGSSHSSPPAIWPPGTFDCEYVATSGAVTERHPFPWLELLVVLGVASVAALLSASRRRRAPRRRRARPDEPRRAPAPQPPPPP